VKGLISISEDFFYLNEERRKKGLRRESELGGSQGVEEDEDQPSAEARLW